MIKTEEGYCLVMGWHRLTDNFSSFEECYKYMEDCKWQLVLQIACIVASDFDEINKQAKRKR